MAVQPFLVRKEKEVKEKEKDALDYLMIGLDVANKGFGIASNYQNIQTAKQQREINSQTQDLNKIKLLDAEQNQNLKASGAQTIDTDKFEVINEQRPGATEVKRNVGFEGAKPLNETVFTIPRKEGKSVLLENIDVFDPKTGNYNVATYNKNTGEVKPTGYISKAKAPKSEGSGKNFEKIEMFDEESGRTFMALYNKNTGEVRKTEIQTKGNKKTAAKSLGAEEKKRLDNINEGLRALDDMEESIKSGKWTISADDNDYTEAQRRFVDSKVRIQSGGSATEDEQAMYRGMTPRPTDTPEMQKRKIEKQRQSFLASRETILNPENNSAPYSKPSSSEPTDEDKQAYDWASKNVLNPDPKIAVKAKQILNNTPAAQFAKKKQIEVPGIVSPPPMFGMGRK